MNIANSRWDLFCQVIDNLGDVGVSLRLAKQLVKEYSVKVRLWIDKPAALSNICRTYNPREQLVQIGQSKIKIMAWTKGIETIDSVADVVVAMFGCSLPPSYLGAMQQQKKPPIWYNVEYLATQRWAETYHGLDSLKPNLPFKQRFFVPSFSPKSAGLLRKKNLIQERENWQKDPQNATDFFNQLDLPTLEPSTTSVSVFCYPNLALVSLLHAWIKSPRPILALIPTVSLFKEVIALFPSVTSGIAQAGALTVKALPWMDQEDFTRLLWSCHCNIVRGEDTFVSALFAAKPFIWHLYPEPENAHYQKLDAFLSYYSKGLPKKTADAWCGMQRDFNHQKCVAKQWKIFLDYQDDLTRYAKNWAIGQEKQPSLVQNLVKDAAQNLTLASSAS